MLSIRELKRKKTKSQLLTSGGSNEYKLDPNDFNKLIELLSNKTTSQLKYLIRSLLTNRELVDIIRRIIIAKMIISGYTYKEINKETGSGQATISLVKQSLLINREILRKLIEQTCNLTPFDKYIKRRLKKGK